MKKLFEDVSVVGLNAVTYAIPFAELEQVLKIISLALSIITSVILIVIAFVKWWKKAFADGKITKEELDELEDILKDKKENENKEE